MGSATDGALTGIDVGAFLGSERERVQAALDRALERLEGDVSPDLFPPMQHAVLAGGKRIRPILCVAAYTACGGEPVNAAYDLGASVEMVHAYSLMHDDLPCMDDAELRRGEPTPHRLYGEERTMRAGVALIPAAALQAWTAARALGCGPDAARSAVQELARAAGAGGMVGGQGLDLLGEERKLDAPGLDALHNRKTGALLAVALRVGGIAAGAPEDVREGLDRYGRAIGLAFQITDDILDATASSGELGKNPSDQALGKSTYVALHGLDEARRRARQQADMARRTLEEVGVESPHLKALAAYIVERRR